MIAIVDTGPLYAAVDASDSYHEQSVAVLDRPDLQVIVPALVLAEATYLIGLRLGARVESAFLRGLSAYQILAPTTADCVRMAELVEQYADFPLGGTDASVIALAERLAIETIITLDVRHFRAVRPLHCSAFTLLPR